MKFVLLASVLAVANAGTMTTLFDDNCEETGCDGQTFFNEEKVCAKVMEEVRDVYKIKGYWCVPSAMCGYTWNNCRMAIAYECNGQEADLHEWEDDECRGRRGGKGKGRGKGKGKGKGRGRRGDSDDDDEDRRDRKGKGRRGDRNDDDGR